MNDDDWRRLEQWTKQNKYKVIMDIDPTEASQFLQERDNQRAQDQSPESDNERQPDPVREETPAVVM